MGQKDTMMVGGIMLSTALKFEKNYREKSPVIAEVVRGNYYIHDGDIIVCHHNHFYPPSPYFVQDDLYSIPFNKTILGRVDSVGNISAVCGNVFGERVPIEVNLDLPPEFQKKHINRLVITDRGWTDYKEGELVFCRPNAPYDIVYNWNGEERRVTKLDSEQICGIFV